MKKSVLIFLFTLGFCFAEAQDLTWVNTLDKAIEMSKKTNKPIMLFFTGSDWCGWCKRLQNEVFKHPEFVTWATNNVVLMEVDFPKNTPIAQDIKEQNNKLQQFFGVTGYPTVWFVNASITESNINFEKLGSTGYVSGGPNAWLEVANGILKKK
jgi:protein disulfide-isomerase